MDQVAKHTFGKMNQDISKSKYSPNVYWEGKNIRIITNEDFGSATNEYGNEIKLTLPDIGSNPTTTKPHLDNLTYPLTNPTILGHSNTLDDSFYLLSRYDLDFPTAKLFYAQDQSVDPYIDSNIRIIIDDETFFENFDSTDGAVEGPVLPTGTTVRVQGFHLATEPNQPAPDPTLYLEVYENDILISKQVSSLNYIDDVTLFYDIVIDPNKVYFFNAYSLPEPASVDDPFSDINIYDYIVDGELFTIHKVDQNYNLTLIFIDTLPIEDIKLDVQGFYENENIIKLYWANGVDELRFINVADPNLLELDKKFISSVPNVNLTQPEINGYTAGGSHTAGSIQYAYNLYNINGAQTKISPLSEIAYLNNGDKGDQINIPVSKSIRVVIDNIDTSFERIKIYSIKYTSKDATPEIKNIIDRETSSTISFIDDNNSFITTLDFASFIFLGGDKYIPKHLKIKDNHLFLFNYKTKQYDIEFDARAYRYDEDGEAVIVNSDESVDYIFQYDSIPEIPETFDAINPTNKAIEGEVDYNKYIWKTDDTGVLGGTGPNVAFEIKYRTVASNFGYSTMVSVPNLATENKISDYTSLKSGETYRLFVEFLLDSGAFSFSKWVADIKIPEIGTIGSTPFVSSTYVEPEPLPDYKIIEVTNPPGYATSGEACSADISVGIEKYIDRSFAITNGLIIYNDEALTDRFFTNDAFTGNYGIIFDREANLKYAFTLDSSGDVDAITSCGLIDDTPDPTDPENPTEINYCYIETELLNIPNDVRVVGWRTSIVERTEFDKTVLTQGMFNPAIEDTYNSPERMIPSYFQRTMRNTPEIFDAADGDNETGKPLRYNTNVTDDLILSRNNSSPSNKTLGEITAGISKYNISTTNGFLYTPEVILNKYNIARGSVRLRRLGLLENTFSYSKREVFDENGAISPIAFANRTITYTGATLLMALNATTEANQIKTGKFISDNKNTDNEVLFSKRRHSFVRYYGGIVYPRTEFGAINNIDASDKVNYIAPIQNLYPFIDPDTDTIVNFGTGVNIPVFYENNVPTDVLYKSFGGSALALVGLPEDFVIDDTDLDIVNERDYSVLMELYRVVENQYGGNTYEARQLNKPIPYSNIVPLTVNSKTTEHYGDTFIQKFNFLKTFRADDGIIQSAEIVSFPVETSINLDLRYDLMKYRPDNVEADENTAYGFNIVYNQLNNTKRNTPKPFNFSEITSFPVNIIPSKLKINGELIDSFTDFLINDVKSLDGQYGEITGVGEFKDNLYAFQKSAIAYLAINPRVQVQASDGIPIELGSGRLIERYQYLTTNSGTLNKWSIVKSSSGLMYTDLLTKSINFLAADPMKISTVNGFYNKFFTYLDTYKDVLAIDNPVLNTGIITFYDKIKEDTYITFLTENPITIVYNGLSQGFTSFVDFFPKHYINADNKIITTNDNFTLWEHNKTSPRSTYYAEYFPSHIILVANDHPDINKIFNNIHFNSEFYNDNIDVPNITFNKLRVWNEYQDTGLTDLNTLIYRSSIKRRLRKWNLIIPRDANSAYQRDRISNYWSYIQLLFDKEELPVPNQLDYKFTLHDVLISYTPKP